MLRGGLGALAEGEPVLSVSCFVGAVGVVEQRILWVLGVNCYGDGGSKRDQARVKEA